MQYMFNAYKKEKKHKPKTRFMATKPNAVEEQKEKKIQNQNMKT